MLGNNSSGSRSLKYGSVIDNIKEVTFIDGRGKKIIPADVKLKGLELGIDVLSPESLKDEVFLEKLKLPWNRQDII